MSVTEVAVPVPGLEEFETVILNPTVVPAGTGVASAVLVIDRDGMFTVTDAEAGDWPDRWVVSVAA